MEYLIVLIVVAMALFVAKNQVTFKNREKAMDYIYDQPNYIELGNKYLSGKNSYNRQFLNVFKWTYSQMFKGLEDE